MHMSLFRRRPNVPTAWWVDAVAGLVDGLQGGTVRPVPDHDAKENLKFSECPSPQNPAEVFTSRFDDRAGVKQVIEERTRVVISHE